MQRDLALVNVQTFRRFLERLHLVVRTNPSSLVAAVVGRVTDGREVYGNAEAPPQLSRDAPVATVFKPSIPIVVPIAGVNGQRFAVCRLHGSLAHRFGLDKPLRLDDRLDDVARAAEKRFDCEQSLQVDQPADWHDHRVVARLAEQVEGLQLLSQLIASVEASKAGKLAA